MHSLKARTWRKNFPSRSRCREFTVAQWCYVLGTILGVINSPMKSYHVYILHRWVTRAPRSKVICPGALRQWRMGLKLESASIGLSSSSAFPYTTRPLFHLKKKKKNLTKKDWNQPRISQSLQKAAYWILEMFHWRATYLHARRF